MRLSPERDPPMRINRRSFLTSGIVLGAATGLPLSSCAPQPKDAKTSSTHIFAHGVASGDPLADRIVLWTRVSTDVADKLPSGSVPVRWRIAKDPELRQLVNQGELTTSARRDFTVKVDAADLLPNQVYYYQFEAFGQPSVIGRTRTLPVGATERVRLAVASCANWPFGFFNVYAHIAARADLDAVVHLGDYLYEYGFGEYGNGDEIDRIHAPRHELITLADYRLRHAQYKTDPDLQAAHRQHPWITVWDDHEIANDASLLGAENHHEAQGEGHWSNRKASAIRAYLEWMPIRENTDGDNTRIFRRFAFGNLLDLLMLDTRLYGRVGKALNGRDSETLAQPQRSIMGSEQAIWLANQLRRSQARNTSWRVLGQQTMFAQLLDSGGTILNTDQWDGYPFSRKFLLDQLANESIRDVAILSGDIHSAWAMDISPDPFTGYDANSGRGALAVEFITPSVTSPAAFGDGDEAIAAEKRMQSQLPHVRFVNLRQHGYLLVDIDATRIQGEWYFVDQVDKRGSTETLGAMLANERGKAHLRVAKAVSTTIPNRAPLIG